MNHKGLRLSFEDEAYTLAQCFAQGIDCLLTDSRPR
jgi:hypothetical protein